MRRAEICGFRYGMLTYVTATDQRDSGGGIIWLARCDCGNYTTIAISNRRNIRSCGCLGHSHKNYRPVSRMRRAFSALTCAHRTKHGYYTPHLTYDEFVETATKPCHYCGKAHTFDRGDDQWNGIDRVDSTYGYHSWNVVPCCTLCNRMKSDIPVDEFLAQVRKIYEHLMESHA